MPCARELAANLPRVCSVIHKRAWNPKRAPKKKALKTSRKPCSSVILTEQKSCRSSVLDMLAGRTVAAHAAITRPAEPQAGVPENRMLSEPRCPVADTSAYIAQLTRDITGGRIQLRENPWISPTNLFLEAASINTRRSSNGERPINSKEALNLALRPVVFAWAPDKIFPGLHLRCPVCTTPISFSEWARPRILHSLRGQCVYIATRYVCYHCPSDPSAKGKRGKKTFMADAPEVMASLPERSRRLWNFVSAGYTICDASVSDLVRSMATRASWSCMSEVITELKTTAWIRSITMEYLHLCEALGLQPEQVPADLPQSYCLSEKSIRKLFMSDVQHRQQEVNSCLAREKGGDPP